MGMSSYILDNVDKFYKEVSELIPQCETFSKFEMKVKDLEGLLSGMDSEFEYLYGSHGYRELWDEYWHKKIF